MNIFRNTNFNGFVSKSVDITETNTCIFCRLDKICITVYDKMVM